MEFLTETEKQALEDKLEELKSKRPEITTRIAEARALGDLKENADYHAARDEQALNEAEIRRLEQQVKSAQVADKSHVPDGVAFIGSVIKLRDLSDDSEDLYKLVGQASGNFDSDEIEVTSTSPMGESLMKARIGEQIKVDLPRGTKRFEVLEIN